MAADENVERTAQIERMKADQAMRTPQTILPGPSQADETLNQMRAKLWNDVFMDAFSKGALFSQCERCADRALQMFDARFYPQAITIPPESESA